MPTRPRVAQTTQTMRAPLRLLQAGMVLVRLVACVNLADLLLARGASRQRELAVRAARRTRASAFACVLTMGAGLLVCSFVGLACSLALTPVIGSLLFGIGAADIVTLTATAAVLLLLAALAAWAPARRAMRVDPVTASRS